MGIVTLWENSTKSRFLWNDNAQL